MPEGAAHLRTFFENLTKMSRFMGDGVGYMTSALLELTAVGSSYLPRLGTAFTNTMERFQRWVAASEDSGKLTEWIDAGISNMRAFGSVVANTAGIFRALTTAAKA